MCTCLHQYGSLVKSEVLNHCLFKPLSLPCLERWCRCHDPTGHGDSVHAPFFFSWHNHHCSIHRSVFSFTVSGRCSLHFLVKLSFWGFCFICVLLFFYLCVHCALDLSVPLSSSLIVLGRFVAVCSRTFSTAALTLLSTVFLSHLSISVASAHWSEIFASWYDKFCLLFF